MTIYVTVEGGLVTSVCTDEEMLIDHHVVIVDYDTEGADEDELSDVVQEDGEISEAFVRLDSVERVGIKIPSMEA